MKKIVFSFLFVATFTMVSAQADFQIGLGAGLVGKVIANQNNYGQRELDYVNNFGASFGLQAEVILGERHGILGGIFLQDAGQHYESTISGLRFNKQVDLKYLQIPLLYRYHFGDEDGVRFFIGAGPYFGFLSSAEMNHQLNNADVSFFQLITADFSNANALAIATQVNANGEPDYESMYQSLDLGLIFNFGVKIPLGDILQLAPQFRIGGSLTDINSDAWRYNNNKGEYELSRNAFGVFMMAVNYRL
jgi:hypothetical protein